MDSLGNLSIQLVLALLVAWTITAFCLIKGVRSIGATAYITATLPYLVIVILFIRAVTLPGASIGLRYYLLELDYSYLLKKEVKLYKIFQMIFALFDNLFISNQNLHILNQILRMFRSKICKF
jgi:SNF family Na+-dependent transporter